MNDLVQATNRAKVRTGYDFIQCHKGLCVHACVFETGSGSEKWGMCEYVIVRTILGGRPVILWISMGGKPKWLPLQFGYHDVMRTSPIGSGWNIHEARTD